MSAEFWAIIGVGGFLAVIMGACTKDVVRKLDEISDTIFYERRAPRD
jgi:hypothetical protein